MGERKAGQRVEGAVDREFRVISALNRIDVPSPRAYALSEDESVVGTPFYIMEYCDGRVLWDPLLPDVPKEGRRDIYRAKVEALALGISEED
ncbi:MAG: hypothetical protein B7Z15_05680, partial [Rhizobiales bacterium 32-66-8]